MSKARKPFQKIQAYGFISTTQQGALKAGTIINLPEGEFPTVFKTHEIANLYGIARRVMVTVELAEDPALPIYEGAYATPDEGVDPPTDSNEKGDQGEQPATGSKEKS
jgi:hypothetical protein